MNSIHALSSLRRIGLVLLLLFSLTSDAVAAYRVTGTVSIGDTSINPYMELFEDSATTIDPSRPIWIVVHGRISNAAEMALLARAIKTRIQIDSELAGGQVLVLDWEEGAEGFFNIRGERWIVGIGEWAAQVLRDQGFVGSSINLVGHSWGTFVCNEIARRTPYRAGGAVNFVSTILAVDPAIDLGLGYNATAEVNFRAYSANSWAIHSSIFGHNGIAVTAHETFGFNIPTFWQQIDHSVLNTVFANMLNFPLRGVSKYFRLPLLTARDHGPWQDNQLDHEGDVGGDYEAHVDIDEDFLTPVLINYVNNSGTLVTEHETTARFTVTPSAGANGQIAPNSSRTVDSGGSLTFTATPDGGYQVDRWSINYAAVQSGGLTLTLPSITASKTVQVTFTPIPGTPPIAPSSLSANAVSSSQINLSWSDVANETGYKLERRLGSLGSWSQITTRSANAISYSDTGRSAETAYSYRVRAYNAAGDSDYSDIVNVATQPAAGTSRTLTIASSNPSSGVSVSSFVGNGNFAFGTTPTSRSFANGTAVGVTCPSTLVGGLVFQKWQLDGSDYPSSTVTPTFTTVTMDSAHTLTAIYGATPPPTRTLSSLAIEGPSSVDERATAQYRSRATYSDGSSAYVNAEWDDDSGYASISDTGLLDTEAVSSDREIEIEATFTAGGVTRTRTKDVTIRNTDAVPTYTLTRNTTAGGEIGYAPKASSYAAGTVVSLHANEDDGYVFSHWSGDASGAEDDITIRMDGNRSVTAHFAIDTSVGNIRVDISPSQAVAEGAQWKMFPFTSWYNSGDQINGVTPKRYYVSLKDIPGWVAPQNIPVDVVGGITAQVTGTYQEIPGTVQVTIEPAAASAAGARWRLDGGDWQPSATTINGVPSGTHQIEFQSISGWSTPAAQQIMVARAGAIIRTAQYAPPPGLPLITTISPKTGPIEGGTLLTIEGANFLASSVVSVGGQAASEVTFLSATRLTAVTPSSPVFGSAEIVVTSGTSSATNANAFAYGIPRGTNMALITSSGGTYQAVACNNQHLCIGQGTTFLVYDIANPGNPVFLSSVAVPGLVQDIALSGNYAIVAANDAGVHVVDISNPSAPRLRGFYDTAGLAYGVTVLAGKAYVADVTGGLLILDVTNPDAPTLLSSLGLGASTFDVALKNSVAGLFAIVAAQNQMFVVDVSNPQSPSKLSEVAVAGNNYSVALAGNLAFLGRLANGVDTVDISNLSSPVSRGRILENAIYVTVAATGNTVVLAGYGQDAFQLVDVSGVSTTARGHLDVSVFSIDINGAYRMAIQNGVVWVAGGTAVFGVNISNLDAPQRIFRKDDQGGRFEKVASFGANIAAATVGKVLAFNASGSTLSLTASFTAAGAGQSCGFFFYGDTLFDVDQSGSRLFERYQMQPNGNLLPLTSLTIPNVSPSDAYFNGSRLLSVGQTSPGDGHAVITEHDPSGANWILRQKHLSFVAAGGGVQIAGAQEFFFLAYFDSPSGKWNLASYNWSASTPSWEISGLEDIRSLQLSHNNRFMHVGERFKYRIYDLIDPANPVCLSTNATSNAISDILITGDEAYLTAFGQGVLVYDIGDKSQPRLIRSYDTPGNAFSLAKIGNRLMVADYNAGIQVLGLPDIDPPQVFITAPVALPQFQTTNSSIALGGGADDGAGQIGRVIWSNDRGGGGVAEGTTDWLVSAVSLQPGTNVLTVTAFDAEGNSGTDQITFISTLPDTTAPVVTITGPKPDAEFVVATNVLTLSGSAADNQSVASVTWSNDIGGSGLANLTGQNWSITNLLLVSGPNVFRMTATDAAGNSASDTAVIFFVPPDTNAPGISIEFPTLNASYETELGLINVSGMTADNVAVSRVEWFSNHGEQGTATGVAPWSINDVPLQPGLNVINVIAYDNAGNSAADSLAVTYTPAPPQFGALNATNGVFTMQITGAVGATYVIQTSSNLVQWASLSTNTIPVSGFIIIADPTMSAQPTRFYRATTTD